jgi:hypothetical protein
MKRAVCSEFTMSIGGTTADTSLFKDTLLLDGDPPVSTNIELESISDASIIEASASHGIPPKDFAEVWHIGVEISHKTIGVTSQNCKIDIQLLMILFLSQQTSRM